MTHVAPLLTVNESTSASTEWWASPPRPLVAMLNPVLNPELASEQMAELTLAPLRALLTEIDLPSSCRLSTCIAAADRECYINAARGLGREGTSVYVEGFAVTQTTRGSVLIPVEHAWLERPDGTVVDPSPAYSIRATGTATYFPAFRWSRHDIAGLYCASGLDLAFPLQDLLPMRGHRIAAWRDALVRAHRHHSALCIATHGELPHDPAEERAILRSLVGPYWVDGPDAVGHGSVGESSRSTVTR